MAWSESRIDKNPSLFGQPLQFLNHWAKSLPSRHSMINATVTNSYLQENSPETFHPAYFDGEPDLISPQTKHLAKHLRFGSQPNPIILEPDEDDMVYQAEASPTRRVPRLRLNVQNSEDADAKLRKRKRKPEAAGARRGNFFPTALVAAQRDMSTVPASQRYMEPTEARPYTTKPNANEDLGFFSPSTFDNQYTTDPWGDNVLGQDQNSTSAHFSRLILNASSKSIIDVDELGTDARIDKITQDTYSATPTGLFYKSMLPNPKPSRSPAVGLRRKASALLSSAVPEDLQKVQDFFTQFLGEERSVTLQCSHGASALSSIFDVIKSDDRKKGGNLPYSHDGKTCLFKCPDCKMIVCAGCGSKIEKHKVGFANLSHSCIDSHFLSFVLVLAKIDARWQLREFGPQNIQKKSSASVLAPASTSIQTDESLTPSSNSGVGIGYGTGHTAGRKYGPKRVTKTAAKMKQESGDNNYLTELLGHLVKLTTDKVGETYVADLLAQRGDLLVALLRVSYLPELISSLVRNDSIMDIDACNAWQMYERCLELLQVFSTHDPLLEFLISPHQEKKSSPGIANLIQTVPDFNPLKGFSPNKKRLGILITLDPVEFALTEGFDGICQPIVHSFQSLVKQSQAFLGHASRVLKEDKDEETVNLLRFCSEVNATATKVNQRAEELRGKKDKAKPSPLYKNSHLASLSADTLTHSIFSSSQSFSSVSTSPTNNQKPHPFDISHNVQQECRHALSDHLQFKFSDKVFETHCSGVNPHPGFHAANSRVFSAAPAPGRMKRLIKELTVLSTTLPPGIYVRVQEDRPEIFKALIVGPESSPYHLGLYEFDFTIPLNYPNAPPLVTFKTTGGGRVRLNPNLYENGKVCLSILGTWSGSASEQWQPKTSTLLQVLVSIQSMILCAEPYYNEPGYEQSPNHKASKAYNENVQFNNIRLGMTEWLEYTGLWDDVLQAHFLAYAEEILSTTHGFVQSSNVNAPAPYTGNFVIPALMEPLWGADDFDFSSSFSLDPNMKSTMAKTREYLLDAMKLKIPGFLAAGKWKKAD
ncbi:hypothetical protein TWF506_006823 [Arthrobotrys conoides]|uniref:UBC core domain-containing protein n=1 Tax=Arthrobotrys conoides TaxID=74498 RepID=A0AAN8PME1_9PEZI